MHYFDKFVGIRYNISFQASSCIIFNTIEILCATLKIIKQTEI